MDEKTGGLKNKQRKFGRLRYINREKALDWSMTANRLLSVGVRGANQDSKTTILTERILSSQTKINPYSVTENMHSSEY